MTSQPSDPSSQPRESTAGTSSKPSPPNLTPLSKPFTPKPLVGSYDSPRLPSRPAARPLHHPVARRKTGVFRRPIGWSPSPLPHSLHGGGDAAPPFLPCASARGRGTMRPPDLIRGMVVGVLAVNRTRWAAMPRSSSRSPGSRSRGLPFPNRIRVFSRRCGAIYESPNLLIGPFSPRPPRDAKARPAAEAAPYSVATVGLHDPAANWLRGPGAAA